MAKTVALLATLDTKGVEIGYMRDASLRAATERWSSTAVSWGSRRRRPTSPTRRSPRPADRRCRRSTRTLIAKSRPDHGRRGDQDRVASLWRGARSMRWWRSAARRGRRSRPRSCGRFPTAFPKIMVSTMASGNVAPWVGTSDITMMYSVTDIMGLNPFMRRVLANAAGAACGMAEVDLPARQRRSRLSPSLPSASRRRAR